MKAAGTTDSRIVITGAGGQLGQAFAALLPEQAVMLSRQECDLSRLENIAPLLASCQPKVVINAAAYTAVDQAETEEALAIVVNARAVEKIAQYCFERHIPLVHFSTDYVFDGTGATPWREDMLPAPQNAYGRSKLAGEQAIAAMAARYQDQSPQWLIFRISWVYDAQGKNFLTTMLKLGKEREEISVVDDQIGAPCFAGDIAAYSIKALEKAMAMPEFPSGIYHLCHSGETSWHGFATEIFRQMEEKGEKLGVRRVTAIPSSAYPTPAVRPHNSRLDGHKLHAVFGLILPDWREALSRCLAQAMIKRKAL